MTAVDDTRDDAYADRLMTKESAWWKRLLNVQAPYQWNLRRQRLGRTLDVGCGIGRNLVSLDRGSLGVDHNEKSVAEARARGFAALTTQEWERSPERVPASFDCLLFAHVIEHMDAAAGRNLLRSYLPYLKPGGKVFFICPQESGYATDETHVRFTDGDDLTMLAREVGLTPSRWFSFPFPRLAGKTFPYNEFCLLARKPV
jgi:SAM-dependent methyltransferase